VTWGRSSSSANWGHVYRHAAFAEIRSGPVPDAIHILVHIAGGKPSRKEDPDRTTPVNASSDFPHC
jgi:hypothetical protein